MLLSSITMKRENKKLKICHHNIIEEKVITLPLYLCKEILKLEFNRLSEINENIIIEDQEKELSTVTIQFSLVCWNWFRICRDIVLSRVLKLEHLFTSSFIRKSYLLNLAFDLTITNPYRLVSHFHHIQHLKVRFGDLKMFVSAFKQYREHCNNKNNNNNNDAVKLSLETITIYCVSDPYINWFLVRYVNELQIPGIKYNFNFHLKDNDLESWNHDEYDNDSGRNREDAMTEKNFETNYLEVTSDIRTEYPPHYSDFTDAILFLDPLELAIKSLGESDSKNAYIDICHSISIHNQRYQSVRIFNQPIPLMALYRLLQAPNLHTLDITLQFHQLFSFYKSYDRYNGKPPTRRRRNAPVNNINIDNIKYSHEKKLCPENDDIKEHWTFPTEFYDALEKDYKEDRYLFCDFYSNCYATIPPHEYSHDLWNKCKELLRNHKTLTALSISYVDDTMCTCKNEPPQQFIIDFAELIKSSKSLKSLNLDIDFVTAETVEQMIENNPTLHLTFVQNMSRKFCISDSKYYYNFTNYTQKINK
ncbi:hypothetical protein DLAC_03039 [Tieghemostelium lacteum]|uniref:Uncharacterized protein n=1 Tax=Tieghemostelium lacteum TaxID=361077 RepID=A0A152A431_TIELA|nr:hypothetical protein DLAC_03039 [Tieghemostelium lacteum]|eukprot:KYR00974.1 hypothetical protein DLAC_03039 [Tieghemostelium lacteum]